MHTISPVEIADAVAAIATAEGESASAELLTTADGRSIKQLVAAAEALRHANHPRAATSFARPAVLRTHIGWYEFYGAARVFVNCGSGA